MNIVKNTILLLPLALASMGASAVDCSNLSAWDSASIYVKDNQVSFSNNAYVANWWTQGNSPATNSGTTGSGHPWTDAGSCGGGGGDTNVSPVANANGPYQADEGVSIAISSAGSSDSDGSIASYAWSFGDGSVSNSANPNHSYAQAGTYTITLTVTDNEGASTTVSSVATISSDTGGGTGGCTGLPSYVAGTAYSAGDRVVNAAVEYNCDVAGWCSSPAGWAYEPGAGAHWQSAWTEIASCGGGTGGNVSPVAEANGTYFALVNAAISFSSSGSSDSDGSIASYSWDFGDGSNSTQANPSHAYANSGTFTVTLTVTDDEGASTLDSTIASISTGGGSGDPLAHRALIGYWHNFVNAAGYLAIGNVSDDWDIVNLSFAENKPGGAAGEVAFAPAEESEQSFRAGVALLQSRGQKVLISLGGANAHISLNDITARDNFVRSMGDIIARYGLDGMDIDLEGGSLIMTGGDTVAVPVTPAIVNLIEATKRIKARFGSDFVLTMAPETAYVQGGYQIFSGIFGAYLPLIHALRNDLTVLHVQHYNTGSILAADNTVYLASTVDFHVALSDMLITGFNAGQNSNNPFPGLRADQVAIGLPATAGAAGSGQTTVADTQRALDCLIKLQNCASYTPAQARTDFRGLMTWSITWDDFENGAFSTPHRAYLNANP